VYIGSADHRLYALDGASGAEKWHFVAGGEINSAVAIAADGTVYVGSQDFKVYALDANTGTKKWEYLTPYWVESSPAIAPDGTVFVLGWYGLLYALAGTSSLAESPWPKFHATLDNRGLACGRNRFTCDSFSRRRRTRGRGRALPLNVIADGLRPLTYEWTFNGQLLKDVSGPRLERWSFSAANTGIYRVRVSNALGFKESEPMKVSLGCMLSVRSLGPGHVTTLPEAEMDETTFTPGTIVQLTASPEGGRRFIGWSGDLTSLENPLRITLNRSLRLFANFDVFARR
jgi:hypothetical protein